MKIYLLLGLIIGTEIGWYMGTGYGIHLIAKKQEVMPIEDYSRLRDIERELDNSRWLYF